MIKTNNKIGYLNDNFKIFHIKDKKDINFEYHHHDFNKIIIFISGEVDYFIEGKSYKLKPWDVLFINNNEIHKPIINSNKYYERIVIWLKPNFMDKYKELNSNLLMCFELANKNKYNLLRLNSSSINTIKNFVEQISNTETDNNFGNDVLKNALFLQLMVFINRLFLKSDKNNMDDIKHDENIENIINYINENLENDLSIDNISKKFFTSKYYLMRKFKAQTGSSIHSYIVKKRLIVAKSMIGNGDTLAEISVKCGFNDYSSFVRAFKKVYNTSPRNYISNNSFDTKCLDE